MLHSAKKEKELLTATVNSMLHNAANVLYGQSRQSVAQRGTRSFGPRAAVSYTHLTLPTNAEV